MKGVDLYIGSTNTNGINLSLPDIRHWCVEAGQGGRKLFPEGASILLDSGAFPDVKRGRVTFGEALDRQLAMEARSGWKAHAMVSYDLLIDEVLDPNGIQKKERWTLDAGWHAVEVTVAAAKFLSENRSKFQGLPCLSCQGVDAEQYAQCADRVLEVAEPGDWFRLRRLVHSGPTALAMAGICRDRRPNGSDRSSKPDQALSPLWSRLYAGRKAISRRLRSLWHFGVDRHDSLLRRAHARLQIRPTDRPVEPGCQAQSVQSGRRPHQYQRRLPVLWQRVGLRPASRHSSKVGDVVSRAQSTLFEGSRLTLNQAIEQTAESLETYGHGYRHWALAFSGGKDSATALAVTLHLIDSGRIQPPESLTVLYADTRMELPPLQASAMKILDIVRAKGHSAHVVLPALDDRFFVYMFGRGVPPPKNRFRWCTPQLKIEPMEAALVDLRDRSGEKLLMLTGVRVGESAARDQRIAVSCGRDGGECGQGWFQQSTPTAIADTLAPILHWRLCHVSDCLQFFAPDWGIPTSGIFDAYGSGNAEGDAIEVSARTGCVGCNLTEKDGALDRTIRHSQWAYLAPLKGLRPLYQWLLLPQNRLRKDGTETRKDGSLVSNPGRMGPLTFEARREGLKRVLEIQAACNARRGDMPAIDLINAEEHARILELIEAGTWPNRWFGTEQTGDAFQPIRFYRGGVRQHVMPLEEGQ